MTSKTELQTRQYATAENLDARIAIHRTYTPAGHDMWDFIWNRYRFAPADRVLEVGCGTGLCWEHPAANLNGARRLLTDFSPGMLAEAQENLADHDDIDFAVADVEDLPYTDGSFTVVLAHFMLYHADDKAQALAELHRVLRPGGWAGIVLNRADSMQRIFRAMTETDPAVKPPISDAVLFHADRAEPIVRAAFAGRNLHIHRYECSMPVTDVSLIIAWAKSSYVVQPMALPEGFWSRFEARIRDEIETQGCFSITKAGSLFIAR